MTDTPNTPELNPQDVQDEDDLDVVVMTDEDGTEYLYDIAARMEHGDNEYVVLVPQDENDDEVVILRSEIVDDETEEFVPEEDDSITDAIATTGVLVATIAQQFTTLPIDAAS